VDGGIAGGAYDQVEQQQPNSLVPLQAAVIYGAMEEIELREGDIERERSASLLLSNSSKEKGEVCIDRPHTMKRQAQVVNEEGRRLKNIMEVLQREKRARGQAERERERE
jgi:hypothetical protein